MAQEQKKKKKTTMKEPRNRLTDPHMTEHKGGITEQGWSFQERPLLTM